MKDIKKNIKLKMWSNYGKTFVEYLYLKKFKITILILKLKEKQILTID